MFGLGVDLVDEICENEVFLNIFLIFHENPFAQFFPCWFFAVHQNTNAVDSAGYPNHDEECGEQNTRR